MAYEQTTVKVEKTQSELLALLRKYHADRVAFIGGQFAGVEFIANSYRVRLRVPIAMPDDDLVAEKARRSRTRAAYQIRADLFAAEERRIWRVLLNFVKAKLVGIEDGVEEWSQAWLPHIVDPASGETVWDAMAPEIDAGALRIDVPNAPRLLVVAR